MREPVKRVLRGALVGMVMVVGASGIAHAAELTNADVQKMVAAKLAPQTIIMTIQSSPSKFNTSPDQVIRLSKAGVPQAVIEAMIAANGGSGAGASAGGTATGSAAIRADEVVMLDGNQRISMRYTVGTMRTAVRALGFGGAATYASLPGPKAQQRISNKRPSFVVAAPSNARPEGHVILASFETRKNGTREVSIASGGGYSFSTGIHPDRIIATTFEPLASQAGAPSGHTVYRITPNVDLAPGEYALVPASGPAQQTGFGATGSSNYFDFGVD